MSVSASTRTALHRVDDPHGLLDLLIITGGGLPAPVRLVNDTRNLASGGHTYLALPFELLRPKQATREVPRAQLRIDNIGRDLTADLEALPPGAELTATLACVYRNTPDTVEYSFTAPMSGVSVNVFSVTATIGVSDLMRRAAVDIRFDPFTAPGLSPD